jgi:hypothetical protein
MFINASAEFSSADSPIHTFCKEHKRLVTRYIQDLANNANIFASERLATYWILLLDGAVISTQVSNNSRSFQQAKAVAKKLLQSDVPSSDYL